jgi:hypothetical protein
MVLLAGSLYLVTTESSYSFMYQFTGRDMAFPCESTKNIFVSSGRFLPTNVIALRAQIYRDKAFLALPRLKEGVPITLGYIDLRRSCCFSDIKPFPSFIHQEEGNCHALQSVSDIYLDIKVHFEMAYYNFSTM